MLKRTSLLSLVVLAVTACPIARGDIGWPAVSGDGSGQECADALRLARKMFNSNLPRLYAPPIGAEELTSTLVLRLRSLNVYAKQELEEDPAAMEQFPQKENTGTIYWQRTAQDGVRIAVLHSFTGWRGDGYSLYILRAGVSKEEFAAKIGDPSPPNQYSLALSGGRPPLIFQIGSSRKMWFIDVGDENTALGPWRVYRASWEDIDPICTLQFRPKAPKDVLSLLPPPVASFAKLIDETIGPGLDEGTLQSTARLRINVQHVWANVAQRPWAVSEADVYNSREEVDAGLKKWSLGLHAHRQAYREIVAAYPIALHSLGTYYENAFSLSKDEARSLAEYVLDIALRANYVFSSHAQYFRYDNINNNPWKSHH